MIVNLGNNKCENNNNSKCHINNIQKSLLMSIIDTPEKDVSNIYRKLDNIKIRASSINSSSELFSFLIRATYYRVHPAKNKGLMLKPFIPAINKSIFPKKQYENILSEKLINELHSWIENHTHVIYSHNVKESLFVKNIGNLAKKQKYLLQISVQELHNDTILPIYEGVFWCKNS